MSLLPVSDVTRKVGVFGGTFDPVHCGHLAIAESVQNELGLDMVLFVVAADQWLREIPPVADAGSRFAMIELATESFPQFETSDVDIVRDGPTYTVDTLADLRDRLGDEVELHMIVGADSALAMNRWKNAAKIESLAKIIVVGRPGSEFGDGPRDRSHPAHGAVYVEGPMVDVSATAIRQLVRDNNSITGLVPVPVANYIENNGLYR